MKLMLVDRNDVGSLTRLQALKDQHGFDVDFAFTYEMFASNFAKGKYRIVLIDFAVEAGRDALELIDSVDPKQRVITISASDTYSEPHGCAYCVEHFNRRRLKKPFSVMELVNLIHDFDQSGCEYYHD